MIIIHALPHLGWFSWYLIVFGCLIGFLTTTNPKFICGLFGHYISTRLSITNASVYKDFKWSVGAVCSNPCTRCGKFTRNKRVKIKITLIGCDTHDSNTP